MDVFCEQIVTNHKDITDIFKIVLTVLVTLIISLAFILFIPSLIGFVLAGVVCYFAFFLISNTNYEYEYIVTNADIDIDKIIAGRKRKRLASTSLKSLTAFGKLDDRTPKFSGTIIKAGDNIMENSYYAEFKHNKYGNVRLIFSPNEKTLSHIKPFVSRIIN